MTDLGKHELHEVLGNRTSGIVYPAGGAPCEHQTPAYATRSQIGSIRPYWAVGIGLLGLLVVLALAGVFKAPQSITPTVGPTQPAATATVLIPTASPLPPVVIELTRLVEVNRKAFTTPHPILSDLKVRQAIAYCTNKPDLIKSVYPLLSSDEQKLLIMNTFIPTDHWAYAGDQNIALYPFNKTLGISLLEQTGWKLDPNTGYRRNDQGEQLSLKFTTTDITFRLTWAAIFEMQMKDCGIRILRFHVPASWWFGDSTGIARRDFELGAFTWVGQPDPTGLTQWACDMIPTPDNGWQGQNDMGWCNNKATVAIKSANNTLIQADRKAQYSIVQQEYTKDVPALPLFNRINVYAYHPKLTGFETAPGQDYWDWNIEKWAIPGKDTLVLGLGEEPTTMYGLIVSNQADRIAALPISSLTYKGLNYTYTANNYVKELPSIENGMAKLNAIDVKDGDTVMAADGYPTMLQAGAQIVDSTGKTIDYKGGGAKMNQLAVTFRFVDGIKWSDGQPVKMEDAQLAYLHDCDRNSNAYSYINCDQILKVDFKSDTEYTITFKPGATPPTYMTFALGWYPAHQEIASGAYKGKLLKDVPAKDWVSLKEIAETPLGTGPYVLKEWKKGQSMTYEANPYWYGAKPATPKLVLKFIDPATAESQLIAGTVDFLGDDTLFTKTDQLAKAEKDGKLKIQVVASATWEHIDFNLFVK